MAGRSYGYDVRKRPRATSDQQKRIADTALGRWFVSIITPDKKWRKPDFGLTENEPGDDVFLAVPSPRGIPVTIDLTNYNEAELAAAWAVVELAFEKALPIVQERDAHARNAEESDPDSPLYDRLHRSLPRLVVRPGYEQ